ncbi:MAG: hypothetical protein HYY17_03875 [Planctomycetes bacterium]|nr:hypothetical protein [Planctomycetota bacterium]
MSRAYYCVFNAVGAEFAKIGTRLPPDANGHKKASVYLTTTTIQDAKQLGKALDSMRDERNDADYRLSVPGFDLATGQDAVRNGEAALKLLAAIDKTKLKADVDHYRRTVDRTLPPLP